LFFNSDKKARKNEAMNAKNDKKLQSAEFPFVFERRAAILLLDVSISHQSSIDGNVNQFMSNKEAIKMEDISGREVSPLRLGFDLADENRSKL